MISSRPAAVVIVAVAPVNGVPPSSDAVNVVSLRAGCVGPLSPPPPHAAAMTVGGRQTLFTWKDAWSRHRNVAFKLATDPSTSKYGFRVSAEYRD